MSFSIFPVLNGLRTTQTLDVLILKKLSDVRSEIHLVGRSIVSTGFVSIVS